MKNNELKRKWSSFFKENVGREPTIKEVEILTELGLDPESKDNNAITTAIVEILKDNKRSWYMEQKKRNTGIQEFIFNKEKHTTEVSQLPGMYYRGNVITKQKMFERADELALSLTIAGVKKKDKIPVCISNVPDLAIILLATSKIGAIPNFFAASFDSDYVKEIIDSCDTDFIFTTDNLFEELYPKLEKTKIKREIVISLADDLPKTFPRYYQNVKEEYYRFENKIPTLKEQYDTKDNQVLTLEEFNNIERIKGYETKLPDGRSLLDLEVIDENPSIFDIFTITYSSGTTNTKRPKPIAHNVLSYLMTMRFHDKDLSGLPEERNVICLDLIPSTSDTAIKSVISDNLSRIMAFEPLYGKDIFIYSLIMNRPDFVDATKSFWVEMAKQILTNKEFQNIDLSFLGLPIAVGEATTQNERALIDRAFRQTKAGKASVKKLLGLPISTSLGIGGGRCESGGMFYTVLVNLMELKNFKKIEYSDFGMECAPYAVVSIQDENGTKLGINQVGELYEKSFCDAVGYLFPKEGLKSITPDFGCYAYLNELGHIIILGRMGHEFILEDGTKVPEFLLSKVIEIDKERILSCEVTNCSVDGQDNIPVAHIELMPGYEGKKESYKAIIDAQIRCDKILPKELSSKILFRIREKEESYPLTECGKRDVNALTSEGIIRTLKPKKLLENYIIINGESYIESPFDDIKESYYISRPKLREKLQTKKLVKKLERKTIPVKN